MIVTLTPNPSHDRTVSLGGPLTRGDVLRAVGSTRQAGGKGVNISRACLGAGVPTVAVLPVPTDDAFTPELEAAGIVCHPVVHDGLARVNIAITEPDGTTTKINSAGPHLDETVLSSLAAAVVTAARGADWVVLAGSLPPGASDDWYATLVAGLRGAGARVAVDTSDAPLRALVERLDVAAPDLMKPNAEELASLTGADPDALESDVAATAAAARVLVERGVGAVLATLGGRGAVLVDATGAWRATPPPTTVVSTVGAGDSSLFGYLLGDLRGLGPAERLASAVAHGSAAAGLPGSTVPGADEVHPELVTVDPVSLASAG